MIDKFNRNIDYARISLTNKCNLKCRYCYTEGFDCFTTLKTSDVKTIIDNLQKLEFKKVRFTGGEPLIHDDILELVAYATQRIEDVGVTTNAVLLDKYLDGFKQAGLKRINISLDTLNNTDFKNLTDSNNLDTILDSIVKAKELGFIIKINVVLIKEYQENYLKLIDFGRRHGIELRFIELMRLGTNSSYVKDNFYKGSDFITDVKATKLDLLLPNVCDYYEIDGYRIGLITPVSNHFCDRCNRIRFTSDYKLRLCLHARSDFDIKPHLGNEFELSDFIIAKMTDKQEKHRLNDNETIDKNMIDIGG